MKIVSKTMSSYFIGYGEKSKRHMFYCPTYHTRCLGPINAFFFEEAEISGS